tara:strand:- start:315 stop:491 length:177 start_codon:yes stop_codon:yes gene_type:complete
MAKSEKGVRDGQVIDDQGFVPYNPPVEEVTPNIAKASVSTGKNRGMGEAIRGGSYKSC